MSIGPVDVVIIEFPGSRFTGELAPLLQELLVSGTIRILDLVVVTKTQAGEVVTLELAGIDETLVADLAVLDVRLNTGVLTHDDVSIAADHLAPGSTTAMLVWENTWAAPFTAALERADARVVDRVTIPRDVVLDQLAAVGIEHPAIRRSVTTTGNDTAALIHQLGVLRGKGLLTDEEYAANKAQILGL